MTISLSALWKLTANIITVGSRFAMVRFTKVHFYDPRPVVPSTPDLRCITCRNSSVLSLLSALLALSRCARVSSFSILVQFFLSLFRFFHAMASIQKTKKKKKSKQLMLHSFLMSSEPRPGPSSAN